MPANPPVGRGKPHPFVCRVRADCGKVFVEASSLAIHERTHAVRGNTGDPSRPYGCTINPRRGMIFSRAGNLANHEEVCAKPPRTLACPIPDCGKAFSAVSTLSVHVQMHAAETSNVAGTCGRQSNSVYGATEPVVDALGPVEVPPFVCTIGVPPCGLEFAVASERVEHARTHNILAYNTLPHSKSNPLLSINVINDGPNMRLPSFAYGRELAGPTPSALPTSSLRPGPASQPPPRAKVKPEPLGLSGVNRPFPSVSYHTSDPAGNPLPGISHAGNGLGSQDARNHRIPSIASLLPMPAPPLASALPANGLPGVQGVDNMNLGGPGNATVQQQIQGRKRKYRSGTEDLERPFVCNVPQCGKAFTQTSHLIRHKRTHSRNRPYVCNIDPHCNKNFADPSHLARHVRTHRRDRPFVCTVRPDCGMSFAQASHLTNHERTHRFRAMSGDARPFVCSLDPNCKKAFAQAGGLATHKRTHTGERPYRCTIDPNCGKAFAQPGALTTHMRTHTGERPFVCTVVPHCGKAFAQAGNLARHKLTHRDPLDVIGRIGLLTPTSPVLQPLTPSHNPTSLVVPQPLNPTVLRPTFTEPAKANGALPGLPDLISLLIKVAAHDELKDAEVGGGAAMDWSKTQLEEQPTVLRLTFTEPAKANGALPDQPDSMSLLLKAAAHDELKDAEGGGGAAVDSSKTRLEEQPQAAVKARSFVECHRIQAQKTPIKACPPDQIIDPRTEPPMVETKGRMVADVTNVRPNVDAGEKGWWRDGNVLYVRHSGNTVVSVHKD